PRLRSGRPGPPQETAPLTPGTLGATGEAGSLLCSLRQNPEALAAWKTVDAEVAPVEGEDRTNAVPISDAYERGIGEIHREIVVLLHQLPHPGNVVIPERQELDRAALEHLPDPRL